MYILAKSPYWVQSKAKGMVLSVSQAYACPSSGMFLFSAEKLPIDENLIEDLKVADDEALEMLAKTNLLMALK